MFDDVEGLRFEVLSGFDSHNETIVSVGGNVFEDIFKLLLGWNKSSAKADDEDLFVLGHELLEIRVDDLLLLGGVTVDQGVRPLVVRRESRGSCESFNSIVDCQVWCSQVLDLLPVLIRNQSVDVIHVEGLEWSVNYKLEAEVDKSS